MISKLDPKMISNKIVIVAIVSLVIISVVAMLCGVNGTLRTLVCTIIAGLAGWRIPMKNDLKVKVQ